MARIESFILGKGLQDGLNRAIAYSKAGADIILIHSKEKTPKEIFLFAKESEIIATLTRNARKIIQFDLGKRRAKLRVLDIL